MTKEIAALNATIQLADKDFQGISIPGLEHMPTSFIPIPRVKLVQANSQDILLSDGKTEARKGSFYYESQQICEDQLSVAIISTAPLTFTGPSINDPSIEETRHSIGLLFLDLTFNEVMTMRFQPGSYQAWKNLIGQTWAAHKAGSMATSFSREVLITSEVVKGTTRSWFALKFQLGKVLDETTIQTATTLYQQYQSYFQIKTAEVDE